jgi:hypothetical protein
LLAGYARDEVHTDPYSIDVSSPRLVTAYAAQPKAFFFRVQLITL